MPVLEAARGLGAKPFTVVLRVTLPQLTPSLLAAGLLTFMVSMASFSAPLLFGGNVRVLTLEIFTARQRGDARVALTETVILAMISLGALLLFQRFEGTRKFAAAALRCPPAATNYKWQGTAGGHGLWHYFDSAAGAAGCDPRARKFRPRRIWTTQTLPPAYTLDNYTRILTEQNSSEVS